MKWNEWKKVKRNTFCEEMVRLGVVFFPLPLWVLKGKKITVARRMDGRREKISTLIYHRDISDICTEHMCRTVYFLLFPLFFLSSLCFFLCLLSFCCSLNVIFLHCSSSYESICILHGILSMNAACVLCVFYCSYVCSTI